MLSLSIGSDRACSKVSRNGKEVKREYEKEEWREAATHGKNQGVKVHGQVRKAYISQQGGACLLQVLVLEKR